MEVERLLEKYRMDKNNKRKASKELVLVNYSESWWWHRLHLDFVRRREVVRFLNYFRVEPTKFAN